jgi:hypothetical protein
MLQLRFINPLVLLIVFTLPCSGCIRNNNCTFVSPTASAGSVIPEGFGVNIDFTDPRPGEMAMLSQSGMRWVRMDLKWDETEKAPGRYDFSAYDRLMQALEGQHLRALFILDYGNPLYQDGAPPRSEATRQAFARGPWLLRNISGDATCFGKSTTNPTIHCSGRRNPGCRNMLTW